MISKEEVLYGQLALASGFIKEDQLRSAIETKRELVLESQDKEGNGVSMPGLGTILRQRGLIDGDQHEFLEQKLAGRAPEILGGYEILKKLGQGAMGAVFQARQISMNRLVAIKILSRQLVKNKKFVARFEREARMVGKLNHANIVAGIDSGKENGVYYYVMEYVEGQELDELIDEKGRLEEPEALGIAIQVARAIEHAASHGMVHRDIKPENVLLSTEGVAKLCDLGLAKPEDDDANLTMAGTSMGTPHYISPEQAQGLTDKIGIRSDMYSLGASLWHALIGDVPFRADTSAMVLAAHIDEPLPDPKKLAPHLSNATCRLLRRLLEKSPEDRHENPTELIKEMQAILDGKPLPPRPQKNQVSDKVLVSSKKAGLSPRSTGRRRGRPQTARHPDDRPARRPQNDNSALLAALVGGAVLLLVVGLALTAGKDNGGTTQATTTKRAKREQAATQDEGAAARAALSAARGQSAKIRKFLRANPTAYAEAIKRLEALSNQYRDWPLAVAEIKQRIADIRSKAESEVSRLRLTLDSDVTRLLGRGKLGQAYDLLASFPEYLEFTAGAKDLLDKRAKLAGTLKTMWQELIVKADKLEQDDKLHQLIALYRDALDHFDKGRQQELRDRIRLIKNRLASAADTALAQIRAEFDKMSEQLSKALRNREFLKAQRLLRPLSERAAAYPKRPELEAIHNVTWDLRLLVLLQTAFEASSPSQPASLVAPEQYVMQAEKKKTTDVRWPLAVAVFYYYAEEYGPALAWMKKAQTAGLDTSRLSKRLLPRMESWLEEAAKKAFEELKLLDEGIDWSNADEREGFRLAIESFLKEYGQTEFAKAKADVIEGWKSRLQKPQPKKAVSGRKVDLKDLKKYLNGLVLKWDSRKLLLVIRYDFKKTSQLKDWKVEGGGGQGRGRDPRGGGGGDEDAAKWEIKKKGWITGGGRTGFYNLIHFQNPVSLTCHLTSPAPRFCGVSIHIESATKRYKFGFNFDGGDGGRGRGWGRGRGRGRSYVGRYITLIDGSQAPNLLSTSSRKMKEDMVYKMSAISKRGQLLFNVNGKTEVSASDSTLKSGRVGLDAFDSEASFTNVRIEGKVDRKWAEEFLRKKYAEEQKAGDPEEAKK